MSARAPPKPTPPHTTPSDPMMERLVEGEAPDTTETNVRYAAYANRLRTILRSAHRYVAYTSDIGESFRPVAHPNWVRAAYGVSWLYLCGDVANEGYKAYRTNQEVLGLNSTSTSASSTSSNPGSTNPFPPAAAVTEKNSTPAATVHFLDDYRTVMAQRAIFQSIASMGLPAFTIHSVVKYAGKAMKDVKNVRVRTWGPIGLGLAVVPALPYMFDEPVEHATEWVFEKGYEAATGRKGSVRAEGKGEKEL
ncbi:hypothetical protein EX30DRAFT_330011 [Ascodesmis nigricans]|uniref:Mitochondrial fission process protein 1 n=1 Tax=Ascodesmis nigricans TaxID=341454 RepID=A0A4S2N153_9PEZI|nr:hypothetical protein EX30DRAFT_330011 [Ascodesmis nigricans]